MSYKIESTSRFDKDLKRLVKKFPSLKSEYSELVNSLKQNPTQGTSLGNSCYKIRIAIASKGKGKSGGARVITNVYVRGTTVFLLTIYDKSEVTSLSNSDLKELLKELPSNQK